VNSGNTAIKKEETMATEIAKQLRQERKQEQKQERKELQRELHSPSPRRPKEFRSLAQEGMEANAHFAKCLTTFPTIATSIRTGMATRVRSMGG
jgi:hypothetical protein